MKPPEDVRLSIDRVAELYDDARPSYPGALFDALFELLPDGPLIVEVGAGTGKATRDLLARGATVHAVEIGPAMAAQLRANVPSARLLVSVGDFETLDIPPSSADAVFSATAYHWISPAGQTERPASILRSRGLLAVIDLIQVDSPADAGFFAAVQPVYERYGEGHVGPPAPKRDRVDPPLRAVLADDERFADVAVRRYDWDQTYSAAAYRKLMLSYSGTQMMAEADRRGLLDDTEAFINAEFGGSVTRPLVATLTTAVLARRA